MSSEAFKALAREQMGSKDAAVLEYCTLDPAPLVDDEAGSTYSKPPPKTASSLVNNWKKWERTLRLNLAKVRAQKLKRDGKLVIEAPDDPAEAVAAAKSALVMESPLEAELYLDKARWDAIENFQGLNIFSEDCIYAYLIKLLLMERKAMFNAEEGYAEYKRLYAAILGEKK